MVAAPVGREIVSDLAAIAPAARSVINPGVVNSRPAFSSILRTISRSPRVDLGIGRRSKRARASADRWPGIARSPRRARPLADRVDPREVEPTSGSQDFKATTAEPRPRLTLVIASLQMGGAERVMTELANHWASRGWRIALVHFSPPEMEPVFPLDSRVTEERLGLFRVSRSPISAAINNLRRIVVLRRAIRATRPDIILSFLNRTNVLTVFAMTGLGMPVIVSEHTAPQRTLSVPWRILREVAYRRAAFVVMLTPDALGRMSSALRRRGRVIPNPLPSAFVTRPAGSAADEGADPDGPTIVGLGSLRPEKGFDLLIEAFARIAPSWPTARLVIWGEGDERGRLEAIRAGRNLVGRVALPGETLYPERVLSSATIFVLPSRREGLPMALIEAMALGRAVIACDCDHGPRDIIRQGVDGLLVPPADVNALAAAIEELLRDDTRRAGLARRAVEVRDRFAISVISAQWETLFRDVRHGE